MKHQYMTFSQQFMVGEIKINTKAQLDRTYIRLLLDAFVPFRETMLVYLDDLMAKHDPQYVQEQLKAVDKQEKKKSKEEERLFLQLHQEDTAEQRKILMGKLGDIWDEENALRQTTMELLKKLDIETRSQTILLHKKENIRKLLQNRQNMIEEGTWEKVGGKDNMSSVFSLMGDDDIGFGFSKISLQASPTNDIYDWMAQYHPDLLPPGDPFPAPATPKKAPLPEKKEVPSQPQTEFPHVPDEVTDNIKTFLAIRRPSYSLLSLEDRSDGEKRAWLALLTKKTPSDSNEQISDVIVEIAPKQYMLIQSVQSHLKLQP